MTGGVVNPKTELADQKILPLFQREINSRCSGTVKAKPPSLFLKPRIEKLVLRVKIDRDIPVGFDFVNPADVIDVGVSVDDGGQLNVILLDPRDQLGRFLARVDVDSLLSFWAGHDVSILEKRLDSALLDQDCLPHAIILNARSAKVNRDQSFGQLGLCINCLLHRRNRCRLRPVRDEDPIHFL